MIMNINRIDYKEEEKQDDNVGKDVKYHIENRTFHYTTIDITIQTKPSQKDK